MATQASPRITRIISPAVAEPAPGTWSNCLVVNGIAYIAGMIARGKDGKIIDGDEYERMLIACALSMAGGNVAEAARKLKTDRPNLYRRMRRLGISTAEE